MLAREYIEQRILQKTLKAVATESVRHLLDPETILQRWFIQNANSDMVCGISITTRNSLLDLVKFVLAQPVDTDYHSPTITQENIQ